MNTQNQQHTWPTLTQFERNTITANTVDLVNYLNQTQALIKSWPLVVIKQHQGQLNILQVLIDHFSKPTQATKGQTHAH